MNRHRFDPVSFALGVAAVALGVVVAIERVADIESGWGPWVAGAVLLVGIAVVPWRGRRHALPSAPEPLEQE